MPVRSTGKHWRLESQRLGEKENSITTSVDVLSFLSSLPMASFLQEQVKMYVRDVMSCIKILAILTKLTLRIIIRIFFPGKLFRALFGTLAKRYLLYLILIIPRLSTQPLLYLINQEADWIYLCMFLFSCSSWYDKKKSP